jgi:Ca-activated chloride channel family protein
MFRFENLAAFNYLWLLPALVLVGIFFDMRGRKLLKKAIGTRLYPFLTSSVSEKKRTVKVILRASVIFFFVVALARPQMGQSKQEVKSEGVEIIFAVDVSESMLSEDVKPSRLDQAKSELSRLMDLMPGNKVGIVAFAGSAALVSPLTNDPAAVKMILESLSTESVSSQGTNFQEALKVSKDAFERGGVTADDQVKVTRVVLIASDGEDHEPGAVEEAKKMVNDGTRIFSLAYGTEKGGAIPVRDGMGFLKGYKKDRNGQTILTTVHGEALKELAKDGQGSFYFASFGGDHIKQVVEDIGKLEKAQFDTSVATQYDERFQLFLLIGILLAITELIVGERKGAFRFWKGRYEVPPA